MEVFEPLRLGSTLKRNVRSVEGALLRSQQWNRGESSSWDCPIDNSRFRLEECAGINAGEHTHWE